MLAACPAMSRSANHRRENRLRRAYRWGAASHPQVIDRVVQEPWLKTNGLLHEPARCNHLLNQKSGLKRGEIKLLLFSDLVHGGIELLIGKLYSMRCAFLREDALVEFEGGR